MKIRNKKLDLIEMLRYRRPSRSRTEEEFIARYIDTLPNVYPDHYGNRIIQHDSARVLIACHTDTVHRVQGMQVISRTGNTLALDKGKVNLLSNCLGADDTAGVYAAIRMIQTGVKATYVFHRDEETGGRGSNWLADTYPEWFKRFDVCLSLDRRGTSDIITSQFGGRTASDVFAWSLAEELGMNHKPCAGIFTDSANYAHIVPECSNLSVGYQSEHTSAESLNEEYLENVIEALVKVRWEELEIERPHDPLSWDDWDEEEEEEDEEDENAYTRGLLDDSEIERWEEESKLV